MDKRYSQFYKKVNRSSGKTAHKGSLSSMQWKKLITVGVFILSAAIVLGAVVMAFRHYYLQTKEKPATEETTEEELIIPEIVGTKELFADLPISEDFLTVNSYSRPGLKLSSSPQYIVIHYTANPGTTAWANRDYFENLKDTGETYASAQFVIGLDGQIIQCVPCNEMSYCSNSYNEFCISIEMCHPDETGNFNDETYNNCVYLVAHLMNYYHLDMDRLIRHYDVTGKNCPKYFVENPDRWTVFKEFVQEYREKFKEEDERIYNQKLVEMEQQQSSSGVE